MKPTIILLALLCAGCGNSGSTGEKEDPVVYRDRLTGCEYLARNYDGSLTPRMGADGKQVCTKDKP